MTLIFISIQPLCPLIRALTFKLLIIMYLLPFCSLFLCSFVVAFCSFLIFILSSLLICWLYFHAWIPFFFCLCVCIDFWLLVTLRFIYNNLCKCDYFMLMISKVWKHSNNLAFFTLFSTFNVFDIIIYIFLFCLSLNNLLWI